MEKKNIISVMVFLVVVLLGFGLGKRPETLGNMKHAYTEPTTSTSTISFSGEAGDRIKFSFESDVKAGNLDILLYDSKGNEVYELDKAKELETFFTLYHSDTYTLAAEYMDFVGDFEIEVRPSDGTYF